MRCSGLDILTSSRKWQELTLSSTSFKALPPGCEAACMCCLFSLLSVYTCGVSDRQGRGVCSPGDPVLGFEVVKQKPVPSA